MVELCPECPLIEVFKRQKKSFVINPNRRCTEEKWQEDHVQATGHVKLDWQANPDSQNSFIRHLP